MNCIRELRPLVFCSFSSRQPTSFRMRSSVLLFLIPKFRRICAENFLRTFHRTPLEKVMPGAKSRGQLNLRLVSETTAISVPFHVVCRERDYEFARPTSPPTSSKPSLTLQAGSGQVPSLSFHRPLASVTRVLITLPLFPASQSCPF